MLNLLTILVQTLLQGFCFSRHSLFLPEILHKTLILNLQYKFDYQLINKPTDCSEQFATRDLHNCHIWWCLGDMNF